MLHEKEVATLDLEAERAKAEGVVKSTPSLDNSRLRITMPKLPEFMEAEYSIDDFDYLTRFELYGENTGWSKGIMP